MKKSSIDNLPIDDLSIGKALSKSIGSLEKGDCPSFEEIAALVENKLKGKRRDKIMRHLSICDKCYKIFLMSSSLIDKKSTRKYHIFHPLALAASILIVVLSIFLFYKSNIIPKTSKQLIEESKVSPPDIMISKKRGIKNENLEIKSNEKEIKEHENKAIQDEELRDKKRFDYIYAGKTGEDRAQKGAITPPDKSKLEGHLKEQYPDEKREKSKKRIEEPRRKISYTRTAEASLKKSNWEIVDSLNLKLENYKKYIPSNDIEKLYKEAISVSLEVNNDFKKLSQRSINSKNYNDVESNIKRVKPCLAAFAKEDVIYIYPDINYFLSRSKPGTVEYRFFFLASSGYCLKDNYCYKTKNINQDLLPLWKGILPELKGVFLKIAIQTINHINKN